MADKSAAGICPSPSLVIDLAFRKVGEAEVTDVDGGWLWPIALSSGISFLISKTAPSTLLIT